MHLYERHFALAKRIIDGPLAEAAPMPPLERADQLQLFLACEGWLRNPVNPRPDVDALSPYWRGLLEVLETFAAANDHVLDPP